MTDNELLFVICKYCDGKGETSRIPWSFEIGKCGTCMGSGVIPLRGYYYINENPPSTDEINNILKEANKNNNSDL